MGIIEKIIVSVLGRLSAEGIKNILSKNDSTVRDRMRIVFYKAQEKFHTKYGNNYGEPSSTFLASQINFENFLSSLVFNGELLFAKDLSPKGFDGVQDVPPQIIEDFIHMTVEEIENDLELKNYLGLKTIIEQGGKSHSLLLQIIEILNSSVKTFLPKRLTHIPQITISEIIGREKEIEEIKDLMQDSNIPVLVQGLGGMGKTTLAKSFIKQYEDVFDHLVWVNYTPTLMDSIIGNIPLVENMNCREGLDNLINQNRYNELYEKLLNEMKILEGENLIVIDNTHLKDEKDIKTLTGHLSGNWKILLTSRHEIPNCNIYKLDVLSSEKAKELFLRYYHRKVNEKILQELLEYIGFHTLTIELIAKTTDKNFTISLDKVLNFLYRNQLNNKQLAQKVRVDHSEDEVELYGHLISIFELDTLENYEQYLLKQFAVLPSIDFEDEILYDLLGVTDEFQNNFISALDSLSRKGYISKSENSFKIHQIIQQIILHKYLIIYDDIEYLIDNLSKKLKIDQNRDNPVDKFPFVALSFNLTQCIGIVFRNKKLTFNQLEKLIIFMNNLALGYKELGKYKIAANLLEIAVRTSKEKFDENNAIVNSSKSNLGLVYQNLARYEEARILLEEALDGITNILEENHPNIAIGKSNLGMVYIDLHRYEEAARLFEQSVNILISNNINGEYDYNVAISKLNLAEVYQKLGRYDEAVELLKHSIKLSFKLGKDLPIVAMSLTNLAMVYWELKKYKLAASLLEKALDIDIKNCVNEHPDLATTQTSLGLVYRDLGRYEESFVLLKKAHDIYKKCFQADHPYMLKAQENLMTAKQLLDKSK